MDLLQRKLQQICVYLQSCHFFCIGMQIFHFFHISLHLISNMQEYGVNRKNNLFTTINAMA